MPKLSAKKLQRRLEIIRRFRDEHHNMPATSLQIADWAIAHKVHLPQPMDYRKQLARELAETMREEYFTDPQGRRVRAKHVAEDLWIDMRDKGPDADKLKVISFQSRRQQVVGDCRQLKIDVDSFNDNYNMYEDPFQLILDFTDDVAELELADMARAS